MKKISTMSLLISLSISLGITSNALADDSKKCAEGQISSVIAGGNDNYDKGNNITVKIDDKEYNASYYKNLNDHQGKGMFSLLVTAYSLRDKVQLWDNDGKCDDFNEVRLMKNQ